MASAHKGRPASRSAKGAYVILIELRRERRLRVGALGEFGFPKGMYAYAGSAMSGLEARVARHAKRRKKVHWHVDHLTLAGRVVGAWMVPSESDLECEINRFIQGLEGARMVARGFGSSDCGCSTHLHLVDEGAIAEIGLRLGPIRRIDG